ncbi:MAG: response regulator [Sneathiellaceae bacterium]
MQVREAMQGRVLVVDDERFSRFMVAEMLRDLGLEVVEAADGDTALHYLEESPGDIVLVFTDQNMPNLTGLELIKAIRTGQTAVDPATPVGLFTGNAEIDVLQAAKALDINTALAKPMSRKDVLARARAALNSRAKSVDPLKYADVAVPCRRGTRAAAQRPGGTIHAGPPARPASVATPADLPGAVRKPIHDIDLRDRIGRCVYAPNGTLLLTPGARLSPRMVQRLGLMFEKNDIAPEVWVVTDPS